MAWFQNNFSELFLGWPSTKIAKNDPALLIKMVDRAKNKQEKLCMCSFPAGASQGFLSLLLLHRVFFPCCCFTGFSFPAGASHVFFPCWCFAGFSFPAGASQGFLSLLVLHRVLFPCWCFACFLSLLGLHRFPTLKFCHGNQTKWPPLIDISQAMTPSLPQAILAQASSPGPYGPLV